MNRTLLLWPAAAILAAAAAVLATPAADAGGGRPRLDFTPGEFAVAMVGSGRDSVSYYLSYKLSNPMDAERTPRLYIEATTETKQTYGDYSDARVVGVAEKLSRTTGLKTTSELRASPLAAGASVDAVANFGNLDPNADDIVVRVYGLWEPIVRTRSGKVFKENRVLVLTYARHGDEYDRPMDPIEFVSRREEVQGDLVELYSTSAQPAKK